eukprot:jgi/Chlat1/6159/Chrsp41S05705
MSSSARFEGKVFLVTGASSGIGAITAEHLASQGAHVWIAARRKERLEALRDKINAAGKGQGQCKSACTVIAMYFTQVVSDIVDAHGKLDGAFNNAGYIPPASPLADMDLDELTKTFNINALSQAACMKVAAAGVRVNAVAPGPTAPSEMLDNTIARMQAAKSGIDAEGAFRSMIPLGKIVDSEDIASTVAFLFDQKMSKSITGQIISVDGGAGVNFFGM